MNWFEHLLNLLAKIVFVLIVFFMCYAVLRYVSFPLAEWVIAILNKTS